MVFCDSCDICIHQVSGSVCPWEPCTRELPWKDSMVLNEINIVGVKAMCGVIVSTAFLACHQCWSVSSSLGWGLKFRALVCGIF